MNKNAPERPNRVVTCQTCGVQMPQRYLARHMQLHEQATGKPLPGDAAQQEGIPLDEPVPVQERSGSIICPACAEFVMEEEFTNHMQANHTNWCPLCHARTRDLAEHLKSKHLLKPIQPPPPYERSWETQKRFICLGCKKKVSVWSYPKHEQPHGATRGLAPRTGKGRSSKALPPHAVEKTEQPVQKVTSSYCQQEVAISAIPLHLANEHPVCPFCHERQARLELNEHIQSAHPGKSLPK